MINLKRVNIVLVIIILVAFLLRIYKLDFQSEWLDELFTLKTTDPSRSYKDLYETLMNDFHVPLHSLITITAFKIFGYSSYLLRFISVIFSVLSVYGFYLLGNELVNKRVGLIASILATINPFFIYYAQEGRMYSLFLFCGIFSFFFLIKFLKKQSITNIVLYTIFTTAMINTHIFGLFTLFSQGIICFVFLIQKSIVNKKRFILLLLISWFLAILTYFPYIKVVTNMTSLQSFWISPPTSNLFRDIFKEFFADAPFVMYVVIAMVLFYLFNLFQLKNKEKNESSNTKIKPELVFVILSTWLFCTFLIPLIASYVRIPMIVSRYVILVLPPIIFGISIGFVYIKNNIMRNTLLVLFLIFSLTDLIFVKKYYWKPTKAQFRETSNFIKESENAQNLNDIIVGEFIFHYSYYFPEKKEKVLHYSLDTYVNKMMDGSTKLNSFWVVGTKQIFAPSEKVKSFLDKNFICDIETSRLSTWCKHFYLKKEYMKSIDIHNFYPFKIQNGEKIRYEIEGFEDGDTIQMKGWAFLENQSTYAQTDILAIKDSVGYRLPKKYYNIEKLSEKINVPFDLSYAPFKIEFENDYLESGNYQLAIYVFEPPTKKVGLTLIDYSFTVPEKNDSIH